METKRKTVNPHKEAREMGGGGACQGGGRTQGRDPGSYSPEYPVGHHISDDFICPRVCSEIPSPLVTSRHTHM